MLIGFGQDVLNQSTVKYAIVELRGRHLVQRVTESYGLDGRKYYSYGELEIVSELKNIKEEE